MNQRLAIGLMIISALGVSGLIAVWLSRERIDQHAMLGALRRGQSDRVVGEAVTKLYRSYPSNADRMVVRVLMDGDHSNHERIIRVLEQTGRADVIPIPPRLTHARAVLAESSADPRHRVAEAMFLASKGEGDLAVCLPELRCDGALFTLMWKWRGQKLVGQLLALASKAPSSLAERCVQLLALADSRAEVEADALVGLLDRKGLDPSLVIRAATVHGPLRSAEGMRRLLPYLRGETAENALSLLIDSLRKTPSSEILEDLLAVPLTDGARIALAAVFPAERGSVQRLVSLAGVKPKPEVVRAVIARLGEFPRSLLAVLTVEMNQQLSRQIQTALAGSADSLPLIQSVHRVISRLAEIGPYLGLEPLLVRALQAEPEIGRAAAKLLGVLGHKLPGKTRQMADQLLKLAEDDKRSDSLRGECLRALTPWRETLPVDRLVALFETLGAERLQSACLELLVGRSSPTLRPLFTRLLGSADMRVVALAARGLVICRAPDADRLLIQRVDRHPALAESVLPALALHGGDRARGAVRRYLRSPESQVRRMAVRAAGMLRDRSVLPLLEQMFVDQTALEQHRLEVGRVLAALSDQSGLARLLAAVSRSRSIPFQLNMARELVRRKYLPVAPLLIDRLENRQQWLRKIAHHLLCQLTGKSYAASDVGRWRVWWSQRK